MNIFLGRKDGLSFPFGRIAKALLFDHLIQRKSIDAQIKEYVYPIAIEQLSLERANVSRKCHKIAWVWGIQAAGMICLCIRVDRGTFAARVVVVDCWLIRRRFEPIRGRNQKPLLPDTISIGGLRMDALFSAHPRGIAVDLP